METQVKNEKLQYDYAFPGFVHRPGVHCISTALRNVLEFHGYKLTEEMVFGLGSAMTISYLNMHGMDPMLGGRGRDLEQALCKALGIELNLFTTKDKEEGWQRLKQRLDAKIPTAINIDMGFLKYQKLPQGYHFGTHGIVICGYNASKSTFLVADTHLKDLKEISLQELNDGRNYHYSRFMDSNNLIYEMKVPSTMPDLKTVIPKTINIVGQQILAKSGFFMRKMGINAGLAALDAFNKELPKLLKLPPTELSNRCHEYSGYISSYGTGGGAFRYLYSRFLKEAATIVGDAHLEELGTFYHQLGDKWEELSKLFKQLGGNTTTSSTPDIFKTISNKITEIRTSEAEGATQLANYHL